MLTVLITYCNGTTDIKDVWTLESINTLGVVEIKVIRDERLARVA